MGKRADSKSEYSTTIVFLALTLGLIGAIVVFRTLPAREKLDSHRELRQAYEARFAKTSALYNVRKLEAETIGSDPYMTERSLRRRGFAKPGETTIEPAEDSGR